MKEKKKIERARGDFQPDFLFQKKRRLGASKKNVFVFFLGAPSFFLSKRKKMGIRTPDLLLSSLPFFLVNVFLSGKKEVRRQPLYPS